MDDLTEITAPGTTIPIGPVLHIRFEGQSFEYPLGNFDIGSESSDTEIKTAVSNQLGVPLQKLQHYSVDRNSDTGNITIRPEASFGHPTIIKRVNGILITATPNHPVYFNGNWTTLGEL